MQVDDEEECLGPFGDRHPLPERPEIVPQGEIAQGRDAGDDPVHGAPWWSAPAAALALDLDCPGPGPARFDNVRVAYSVSTPVSRVPSTCCCIWSPRTRSTSSTSPCSPSSTASSACWAQREEIDFNQLSEFLLVAAILIELKSQKLLPGRETSDEDDDLVGWEERDLLLARLLECRAYAAAADVFVALAEQALAFNSARGRARRRFRGARPRPPGRDHARRSGPGLPARIGRAPRAAGRSVPRHRGHPSVSEAVSDLIAVPAAERATSFRSLVEGCPHASRSLCASWPCSSCARWAGSRSVRAPPSATWRSRGWPGTPGRRAGAGAGGARRLRHRRLRRMRV